MQEPDFDPQLADAILNGQPPINRREMAGASPDELRLWVDLNPQDFNVTHHNLWVNMERELPSIEQTYDANDHGNAMSFYVAREDDQNGEKLFVLLCEQQMGGNRPVALWTFE